MFFTTTYFRLLKHCILILNKKGFNFEYYAALVFYSLIYSCRNYLAIIMGINPHFLNSHSFNDNHFLYKNCYFVLNFADLHI